jgi:hypothetical protein
MDTGPQLSILSLFLIVFLQSFPPPKIQFRFCRNSVKDDFMERPGRDRREILNGGEPSTIPSLYFLLLAPCYLLRAGYDRPVSVYHEIARPGRRPELVLPGLSCFVSLNL